MLRAASQKVKLNTTNNDIFEVSETILVQGVKGYEADGVTESKSRFWYFIFLVKKKMEN